MLALSDVSRVGGHPDKLCYVACGVQGTWDVSVRTVGSQYGIRPCYARAWELGRTVRGDPPSRDSPYNPINLYPADKGLNRARICDQTHSFMKLCRIQCHQYLAYWPQRLRGENENVLYFTGIIFRVISHYHPRATFVVIMKPQLVFAADL